MSFSPHPPSRGQEPPISVERTERLRDQLAAYLRAEDGALAGAAGHVLMMISVSIPLGIMFARIYIGLCCAGSHADRILGFF